MKGELTIKSNVSEQDLIENCLMYYHAKYDYKLILVFHAMAHYWKWDKVAYYINLIEGGK